MHLFLKKMIELYKKYYLLLFVFLLLLLLFRNPFSQRTLIPNLEPYPDTFNYIVPPRNFAMGKGYALSRGYGTLKINVPPSYSLTLIPAYLINSDPRMFYFVNVLLSIVVLLLINKILVKLNINVWITSLALFLYVTNYFSYWYPQWAMAENLLNPMILTGLLLSIQKRSFGKIIGMIILAVLLYLTKYAAAPVSFVLLGFAFFELYQLVIQKYLRNTKKEKLFLLVLLFFIPFVGVLYKFRVQITSQGRELLNIFLIHIPEVVRYYLGYEIVPGDGWVSAKSFVLNFPQYLKGLSGESTRFLWDFTPILPSYIAKVGLVGLFAGLFYKDTKRFSLVSITATFVSLFFISFFYAVDMRYLGFAISLLIIGFAIALNLVFKLFKKRKLVNIFFVLLIILGAYYFYGNAIRIKYQIVLNLKYAETPWYYLSVLELNKYFDKKYSNSEDKPIVISPMPPFYFDYFSNDNYKVLPLSQQQEFRSKRENIWGPGDYSDFHDLYRTNLKEDKELYVATYGLGVEGYLHADFNKIRDNFHLSEVFNGCYEQCKIYKVELINADKKTNNKTFER